MKTFTDLQWWLCAINLTANCLPEGGKYAHPLSVFEAIVKGITEHAHLENRVQAAFYWPDRSAQTMRLVVGRPNRIQ
ncbi:hypothetical protein, partial [Methyloglobulus sp.]|uniref:hypothetical protein n=1 Tax=Methyloglobulus sp. TaxID=2518622 RepID=UPI003989D4D3